MRFKIKYGGGLRDATVKYISEEFSFDTKPAIWGIDFDLVYNKLNLSVYDRKIVQVWGYAGDVKWNT